MENKDLMLLEELIKLAKYIFTNYVTLNIEGKFTAAELSNCKDSLGRKLMINYNGHDDDIHEINFDWGGYSLPTYKVFDMLYAIEKICNIRGEKKTSFVYGKADNEVIKEKAMYYTGSMERGSYNHETGCHEVIGKGDYKVVVKKTSLKKLSDNVAEDKKGRMFYKSGDIWYMINERTLSGKIMEKIKNEPDYIFGLLEKFDFSFQCELNGIFVALFEALKSERTNTTPEQKKSENEAENSVICNNVGTDTPEKSESVQETHEDYPPDPYNESDTGDLERPCNNLNNKASDHERHICDHAETSANSWGNSYHVFPCYLRQKVFPTELFCKIRKINRFKPRYFAGYTNYHLCEESALERKRNGNASVYRVLIRGET